MTIDLCIVNYNTKDKVERLLNCLHRDYIDDVWNLYLVDNDSPDDSQQFLSDTVDKYNYVSLFLSKTNLGYARACNLAAAKGNADIIGLLNADVWLYTTDVENIQHEFDNDPDIAIMGPKQRNEQGEITHGGIFGTLHKPAFRNWKTDDPHDKLARDKKEAVTVSGSAYFIRRSVWEELTSCPIYRQEEIVKGSNPPGAFLPTQMYYEETYCSYHAKAHDHKVYYNGHISIGHSWAASTNGKNAQLRNLFLQSRDLFRAACDNHNIEHD